MDDVKHTENSIAIIGMACVYPGAHSPQELWQNILAGRRFFRKTPPERFPLKDYYDPDPRISGKTYSDQMAVITNWSFDPIKFGIPPLTVNTSDLTHWLALSTAAKAIEDANLNLAAIDRSRVSVIIGNSLAGEFARSYYLKYRWPYVERALRRALELTKDSWHGKEELVDVVKHFYASPLPEISEDSLAGCMSNTIAGRICSHFDFGGCGFTVDGACSSSLLSVCLACDALFNGEADFALAGGVDVSLDPFEIVGFAKTHALAFDDIRPYDERASGMLPGEGCGILVLVREEEARKKGYNIYARIRGWGYSSDGSGTITAPEIDGQVRALHRAYGRAGYSLSTVDLIEGHGTGTPVGDRVEIAAILRLLSESSHKSFCRIGSIKGNIGHCKAAAGVAGLIKVVMALHRKILPPTMKCEHPNPVFGSPLGRLRVINKGEVWKSGLTPRRASVSAFGFGGSNAHITLEEVNTLGAPCQDDLAILGSQQSSELILFSGRSLQDLLQKVKRLIPLVERISRAELTDLSATLLKRCGKGVYRLGIITESPWHLAETLRRISVKLSYVSRIKDIDDPAQGVFAGKTLPNPICVALFPGQGSQRLNMGEYLLRRYPFIGDLYNQAEIAVADVMPQGLKTLILRPLEIANQAVKAIWDSALRQTNVAQPSIVMTSVAILRVLRFLGLQPAISIGHSLGEISALCAGGAYDEITAIRIAALRGKAIASLKLPDQGAMCALRVRLEEVEELITPFNGTIVVSNYNSLKQTVVSGSSASISRLLQISEEKGVRCIRLPVSHAFHSWIVADAAKTFYADLEGTPLRPLSNTVISTNTGARIAEDADLRTLLDRHIWRPVRFLDAVLEAYEQRPSMWIEVGSGCVLIDLLKEIIETDKTEYFSTDREGIDGFHLLNKILARAYTLGFPLRIENIFAHRFHRPFCLDDYDPLLITNPCERNVERPEIRTTVISEGNHEPLLTATNEVSNLLCFAMDWIANRTGFPKHFITPDTKLRGDLNLDSIKSTELIFELSRRACRVVPDDPLSLSNITLKQLVNTILKSVSQNKQPQNDRRSLHDQFGSLTSWIHTFVIEKVSVSLLSEDSVPLSAHSECFIVTEKGCEIGRTIANRMKKLGMFPVFVDLDSFDINRCPPRSLGALIVILPVVDRPFHLCNPAEFDIRFEGLAKFLFQIFRWIITAPREELSTLRCIVVRPFSGSPDYGLDLDAGAALMKTLRQEYPGLLVKWLRIPITWSTDKTAKIVEEEVCRKGEYVFYEYQENGSRLTEQARLPGQLCRPPLSLNHKDVVLAVGGAKGITSELAFVLARQTKASLALLGTSQKITRSEVGQDQEMDVYFSRLEQEGVRYLYTRCDVTKWDDLKTVVSEVEKTLGPVTVILHGAGISRLNLFCDMTLDQFLHCLRVKVKGLYNLISILPPDKLKAVHVISSVLGQTGMKSQADYSMANSWLDRALMGIQINYPNLHCLSLGYSVWSDKGMGKKLNMVEFLRSLGVFPIGTAAGVAAYMGLIRSSQESSRYLITGHLTSELEALLFPVKRERSGRYLENILVWVPGVQIIAEASLSYGNDPYLLEHVFEGTPILPGVMAIEMIAEAAMACVDSTTLPVIRNVLLAQSVIIPNNAAVRIRILALADMSNFPLKIVKVIVRSEMNGFTSNLIEADCIFDPSGQKKRGHRCKILKLNCTESIPEEIYLDRLFQGKLFRRIIGIAKREPERECITVLSVPNVARYFGDKYKQEPLTPFPATRDACLQSVALILHERCLPVGFREIRFYRQPNKGSHLICRSKIIARSKRRYVADISIYTTEGALVEKMRGVTFSVLSTKSTRNTVVSQISVDPVSLFRVNEDLRSLLPGVPISIGIAEMKELGDIVNAREILHDHICGTFKGATLTKLNCSTIAKLLAIRRAVLSFCETYKVPKPPFDQIYFQNDAYGKPELAFTDFLISKELRTLKLSFTNSGAISLALVGLIPLGVDLESVTVRDAETWRGLLGSKGYALALRISAKVCESFDCSATRIWTILESMRKIQPVSDLSCDFEIEGGYPWISIMTSHDTGCIHFLSSTVRDTGEKTFLAILTIALNMPNI